MSTINLATTETWTDKQGQRQEQTEWHRVVLWGKMAESLGEYLVKGKQIAVEGKLQTRKWEDKDGNERHTTEIRADRVTLLGGNGSHQQGAQQHAAPQRNRGGNRGRAQSRSVISGPDDALPDTDADPVADTANVVDDDDQPF